MNPSGHDAELRDTLAAAAMLAVAAAVITIDDTARVVYASDAVEPIFGYRPEELLGKTLETLIPECLHEEEGGGLQRLVEGKRAIRQSMQTHARRKDGSACRIELSFDEFVVGGQRFVTAAISDFSGPNRAFDSLQASEEYYRQLFEKNVAGVYRVGLDGRIHELNEAMAQMLGYSRDELLGWSATHAYYDIADREVWLQQLLDRGSLTNWVHKLRRRDGSAVWTLENCSLVDDPLTGAKVVLGTAIDITERKALEERLELMAYRDPLTGLPNRRMLQEMAEKALARATREGGRIALLYVDLVRFKRINDVLGHSAGDQVLREVARRFESFVRATDTLARVGGDEFALLLVLARTLDSVLQAAKKMREVLSRPFVVNGQSFQLDARIGVALYPDHSATFDELLSYADLAMHQPTSADGEIAVFRPVDAKSQREDLLLEERFRRGLADEEFELHYQPIFQLPGRRPAGVEGLARWRQPDGRLIGADQFISIAEQTGLIRQLDRWALRAALRQVRRWDGAGRPGWIALNLTPSAFDDFDFPEHVRQVIDEEGVSGQRIALEVTERVTMRDPAQASRILHELKEMDLSIVVDDFGRGHSSLAYLKDFPVDAVKIDRFFVGRVEHDVKQQRLVEGIIALCNGLGVGLIAEGVETSEQLEWLEAHGCEYAQGFHLMHPVPPDSIPVLFDSAPTPRSLNRVHPDADRMYRAF